MDERFNKPIKKEEGPKKPEVQEKLEHVFEEIISSKLKEIKEFKRGSSRLILLMVELGFLSFGDLIELHKVMKECLDSENVSEDYKRMLKMEYEILWPENQ